MLICGNSRPASGAEHHLSHFWEMLALQKGDRPELHGVKVGIASVMVTGYYRELAGMESFAEAKNPFPADEVREVFGDAAEGVIIENTPDPLGEIPEGRLGEVWPEICREIYKLPDEAELVRLLKTTGGAYLPSRAGVSEELAELGMKYGRYTRRRLTLLRLSDLLQEK